MNKLLFAGVCLMAVNSAFAAADNQDEFTLEPATSKASSVAIQERQQEKPAKAKQKTRKCYRCMGKGVQMVTVKETCERCEGAGILVSEVTLRNKHWANGYGTEKKSLNKQSCPRCNRSGKVSVKKEVECSLCKGEGTLTFK